MNTLLNDDPQIVEAIKARIVSQCLPLWADKGWDSATGSFIERLGADGAPDIAAPRRIRVQARQIYVYAKAAQLGWFPQGREIARKATAYLMDRGRHPDGGYVHLLAPDGAVLDDTRDTYDHAFVLLALANVLRLEDDPRVRSEIEAVVAFLDKSMRGRFGGFVERLPAVLPRRQNPHMHMFEAMIALYEATGDPIYQTRAGDMFSLLARGFFDDQTGTISEYFQENWMPIEPVVIEPGHQAEWLWLLKEFERITGCPTARFRSALMKSALRCVDARTLSTNAMRKELLPSRATACGRRRKSSRLGLSMPKPAIPWRPARRARRWRGSIVISSAIRLRAAGTIISTAKATRWSISFRHRHSII